MTKKIGTYGEKSLHRELKWRIDPTGEFHEAPVGKFIADIKDSSGITEIQTRSFYRLRDKLSAFLPDHIVTLVYPLPREKLILWIDKDSGEIIRERRSPKHSSYYSAFWELYQIKQLLTNANLKIRLLLVDVAELRYEGARRKRHLKIDTSIRSLQGELSINCVKDYQHLIPACLNDSFTSRDYATSSGLNMRYAGAALNVLLHVGALERIGKSGRLYLYKRCAPPCPDLRPYI